MSIFSRQQVLLIFNFAQPLELKPQVVQSGIVVPSGCPRALSVLWTC